MLNKKSQQILAVGKQQERVIEKESIRRHELSLIDKKETERREKKFLNRAYNKDLDA